MQKGAVAACLLESSSVCILIFVCPFSSLDTGLKPKRFHTSDLKLVGAAALSQTLSPGSPLPFAASATFDLPLDLYEQEEHVGVTWGQW